MTPEKTKWYDTEQMLCATPRELTSLMFEATKILCQDADNECFRAYWETLSPATRDVFLSELVKSIVIKAPP